jgi:hypothetical protein
VQEVTIWQAAKAQAKQIDTSKVDEQPRREHNGDRADGEENGDQGGDGEDGVCAHSPQI